MIHTTLPMPPIVSGAHRPLGMAGAALVALALLTTAVGVVMAAVAAAERTTAGLDRALVVAVAVVLALGAHLLPAWARRLPAVWLLWLGCVAATLYGHAHFFAGAGERSGGQRAVAVQAPAAVRALEAELQAIHARPLAVVAAELAQWRSRSAQAQAVWARCDQASPGRCPLAQATWGSARARTEAMVVEYQQAERAAELRRLLGQAAAQLDVQRSQAVADPVDRALAQALDVPLASFHLAASLGQALLVELLAAVLWVLAWGGRPVAHGVAAPQAAAVVGLPAPVASEAPARAAPRAERGQAAAVTQSARAVASLPASPALAEVEPQVCEAAAPVLPPMAQPLAGMVPLQGVLFDEPWVSASGRCRATGRSSERSVANGPRPWATA